MSFPPCRQCGEGELVPLSDYGGQGAEVLFKAWVCTNPRCGFNLKIRQGEIVRDEPVEDGAPPPAGPPRRRPMR